MSAFYDLNKTPRNILNRAIVRAIISENNGALFDPSDMSTLYQNAAGTIPVTAVEQPIGKMLDKSGNGWHATQSITASRPTLSARYNLLTKTEDFSDAVWGSEINLTTTNNTAIAPDGTLTADTLTTTAVTHAKFQPFTCSPNTRYTFSFYAKRGTMTDAKYSVYDLTGASNIVAATSYYSAINADTFSRVSITFTTPANCISCRVYPLRDSGVIGTIHMWGADVRLGLSGPYQRVNTATDYNADERYFQKHLRFDGVDDFINLPFMNLYGGGSASIVCARDAVSQTTDTYIISERSTTDADPKYFPSRQLANAGNMDTYITDDAGAVVLDTVGSPFSGVANAVIRSIVDSGNNLKLFKNGVLAANDNYTRSGTLTLNNTTIGASVSTTTSNYASMKLYGLIITKSALTDSQRVACERYLGRKSGVQL